MASSPRGSGGVAPGAQGWLFPSVLLIWRLCIRHLRNRRGPHTWGSTPLARCDSGHWLFGSPTVQHHPGPRSATPLRLRRGVRWLPRLLSWEGWPILWCSCMRLGAGAVVGMTRLEFLAGTGAPPGRFSSYSRAANSGAGLQGKVGTLSGYFPSSGREATLGMISSRRGTEIDRSPSATGRGILFRFALGND